MFEIKYLKDKIVVYATSYVNPLENFHLIEKELRKHQVKPQKVLFDFLLCNGNEFNRFVVGNFDGKELVYNSFETIPMTDDEIEELNVFYIENKKYLKDSVLTKNEIEELLKQ